jgi:purine-cytosine permease-like protein
MKIRLDQRLFGFFGLLGFLGFIPGNFPLYMLVMLFFFFVAARPQTKTGEYLNDERWIRNITKACATSFFVFLIPSMLNIAFLRLSNVFSTVSLSIPVAALLSLFLSFYYYDQSGD